MIFVRSSVVVSGSSMRRVTPSHTSPRLCGGMFVAIPTAMPVAPLTSRLGSSAGSTVGSRMSGSARYVCAMSTVSLSMSSTRVMAMGDIFASV